MLPAVLPNPPPPFHGRDRETAFLDELAESTKAELFVLYGRRRVGKTELLQRFCQGRRAVYFLAAQVRSKDNLRAFAGAVVEGLDDRLAGEVEFPDWGAALAFLTERAEDERLIVVLDEFPYLCESDKSVPSQVQRFWDTRGKHSRMLLVLCGSQVSFMEKEVLAERSPLFGRRTGQRRLEPLAPADAIRFFPRWELGDRVLAGFGGVHRRFERLGHWRGAAVVDDYAHHPTEVSAALKAARQACPDGRIHAVFQPHLYSRTHSLAQDFGRALLAADHAVVTEIYGSREAPVAGVTGELVVAAAKGPACSLSTPIAIRRPRVRAG